MPVTATGLHYRLDAPTAAGGTPGRPVLLQHGIGVHGAAWDAWVPTLAADRPVIRPDMRGWGRSPVPPEDHDWTMEELVEDLWQVADAAGQGTDTGPIHLFGESFGGTIVLAAALAQPARTASVTISNASFRGHGVGEFHNWPAQFADGADQWSLRMMANRFAAGALDQDQWDQFHRMQSATRPHVAIGLGRLLAGLDLGPDLGRLQCPLSVVLPDGSPFVPVSLWSDLAARLDNIRLRMVPGVRHGLPFSHAGPESDMLATALNRLDQTAT